MFQGLRTAIHQVADLDAARRCYPGVPGVEPYFDQPFYDGFDVGGFELGLQPDAPAAAPVENVVAYRGVDDAQAAVDALVAAGASLHVPPQDVGEEIVVATVRDPFGNVFGVIRNPHLRAR